MLSSVPFSIYFLSFLNYFTLCSLYVLLNFPIPEHIYHYLAYTYSQINRSIFQLIGIDIDHPILSDEKVLTKRGIHFGVSSDIFKNNTTNFIIIFGNVAFIYLIQFLLSCFKNSSPFKLWKKEKQMMIIGHVVNLILPFTLPWTFVMINVGFKNFNTKLNAACYILLFFLCLFFPIYFFFELLQ